MFLKLSYFQFLTRENDKNISMTMAWLRKFISFLKSKNVLDGDPILPSFVYTAIVHEFVL